MNQSQEGSINLSFTSYIGRMGKNVQCLSQIQLESLHSQLQTIFYPRKDILQQIDKWFKSKLPSISKSQQCKRPEKIQTESVYPVHASQGYKAKNGENHGVHINHKINKEPRPFHQISSPQSHRCCYQGSRRANLSQVICSICKNYTLENCTSECNQFCLEQKSSSKIPVELISDEKESDLTPEKEQQKKQETNMQEQKMPTKQQPEKHQKQQKPGCCHCNNGCLKKHRCGCVLKGISCSDKCNCIRQICQNQNQKIVDQILSLPGEGQNKTQSDTSSLSSNISFKPVNLNNETT